MPRDRGKPLGGRNKGIYTRPGHGFYVIIDYYDFSGGRKFRTKTCTTLSEARKWRDDTRARLQLGLENTDKPVSFKEMTAIVQAETTENRTAKETVRYLDELTGFFGPKMLVKDIDDRAVARYKSYLDRKEKGSCGEGLISNGTKNHYLKTLRQVLIKARDMGKVTWVPRIRMYPRSKPRELTITLEDFDKILEHLPGPPRPHKAIMIFALITGQRWGDVSRWKWSNLSDDLILYDIRKTGKSHFSPLLPLLKEQLGMLDKICEYIFPNPATKKPYTSLKNPLKTACKKAGVAEFTFHMIRHLTTEVLLRLLRDPDLARRYMGWSSQAMVDHQYGHAGRIEDIAAKSIAEAFSSIKPSVNVVLNVVPQDRKKEDE